jgi:quinolinate synthase
MPTAVDIVEEILTSNATHAEILAHHYRNRRFRTWATRWADSLELSRKAGDGRRLIAFCGVWLMAETAKCAEPPRSFCRAGSEAGSSWWTPARPRTSALIAGSPGRRIVSYINTSVEVRPNAPSSARRATPTKW